MYGGYSEGYFWPVLVYFVLAAVALSRFCRLKNKIGIYTHDFARLWFLLLFKISYD